MEVIIPQKKKSAASRDTRPLDGNYLLKERKSSESESLKAFVKLHGMQKMKHLIWLLLPISLLGGIFGLLMLILGIKLSPVWMSALGICLVTMLLVWFTTRRISISPSQVSQLRALALFILSSYAIIWTILLHQGLLDTQAETIVFGASGIVLSAIPFIYWMPGYFLVLVTTSLVSLFLAPAKVNLAIIGVTYAPMLLFGISLIYFNTLAKRAAFKARVVARDLAESQSQYAKNAKELKRLKKINKSYGKELTEVRQLAVSADYAKTEFLATMSHEIRTPLNGILPILEVLKSTKLNAEQLRYIRTAHNSSRHLLRIINDILDFTKAESGKLELEKIELNLRELISEIVDLMRSSASNKGIFLKVSMADDVPTSVRGDPIRLRQIITNLVSNAIKFTENGGVRITVAKQRSSRKEVELMFSVTDTGLGLTEKVSSRLFKSFTQADASTTRRFGGTGLGLVICKRLVNLMGGEIGVKSRPGEGSVFWFSLPMRKSIFDEPSSRKSLNGVRLVSIIQDYETSKDISAHLLQWGIEEQKSDNLLEVLSNLSNVANLGVSWLIDVLLIDSWGIEGQIPSFLAELKAKPKFSKIEVIIAGRSRDLINSWHENYDVVTLHGLVRGDQLHHCLNRVLDVESSGGNADDDGAFENYKDLNVDNDSIVDETFDGIEADPEEKSKQLQGKVLLVEDNPVNLAVVRKIVSDMGLQTVVADNGQEAITAMKNETFDLVLMDCQMPVLDGYKATGAWREMETQSSSTHHLSIVAMTANAMQGDREKCLAAGMDDYLAKPISIKGLSNILQKWLPDISAVTLSTDSLKSQQKFNTQHQARDSAQPVLDRGILDELREVMDDQFSDLVRTYLKNTPVLLAQLDSAVAAQDVKAMVLPAHSLKSSSANLGALQLSSYAKDLEMVAKEERFSDSLNLHGQVLSAAEDAKAALKKLI